MNAMRITENTPLTPDAILRMHDQADSMDIADFTATSPLTPDELHAIEAYDRRKSIKASFEAMNDRPGRAWVYVMLASVDFWLVAIIAALIRVGFAPLLAIAITGMIGWHMSDAYARAMSDNQMIEAMK